MRRPSRAAFNLSLKAAERVAHARHDRLRLAWVHSANRCACALLMACLLRRYMLDGAGKSMERLSMIAGGTGITPMYQVRPSPVGFVGGPDAVVPVGAASTRNFVTLGGRFWVLLA